MHTWAQRCLVAGLLIVAGADPASADPPAKDKPNPRLKAVLAEWQKATQSIRQLHYEFVRTEEDTTFNTEVVSTGQVYFKKADLFRMDTRSKNGETEYLFVAEAKLHQFRNRDKTEVVEPLSEGFKKAPFQYPERPEKPRGFWESWLRFRLEFWTEPLAMLCQQFPIRQWEKHCHVTLKREDENWIYLEIKPRTPCFKADFQRMEVVLNAKTFHLRRIFFEQPNGSTVTTDVEKAEINGAEPITLESIRKGLPQGWKIERVSPDCARE